MVLSQKCNCCIHDTVCSKKESYQSACKSISNAVAYAERDLLSVNVKCTHFSAVSATRKGGAE
jgi:hypothetical protein